MLIPLLAAGAFKSGEKGGYNPLTGLGDLWKDVTGVTAAKEATDVQIEGTGLAIDEQQRQFDAMQEMLSPYTDAGAAALDQQQALTGALGPEAQQEAIQAIQESPSYEAMIQSGETSILQNAAATGGLRGGRTQDALAQFRPQVLSGLIDQRYSQLGGISGMGQASAAGVGQAGIGTGANIGNLLTQQGQLEGSNILGQYNLQRGFLTDLAGLGVNIGTSIAGGGF